MKKTYVTSMPNHKKKPIFLKKLLTNLIICAKIDTNLNITNNDCDEEGRSVMLPESCRAVRDNGKCFRMTYRF